MAATLTDSGDLTYVSFGIEKVESTPDGDLMVYGRATDGSVDHDQQIVHPDFSSKAIAEWLATGGNVRVQHNPQRDPAGIGVEAHTDKDGGTWVKALIVEPIAKTLVSKGALRAYSVGIANPTIERDVTGKARGGIIKSGKIVEISLVDRPANASCGFQLVKSAGADGHAEYVGKMVGDEGAISKALDGTAVTKSLTEDISSFDVPADFNINFTPNDLMKIMQEKIVKRHYNDLAAKATRELGVDNLDSNNTEKVAEVTEAPPAEKAEQPDVIKDPDNAPGEEITSPQDVDADGDRDGDGVAGKATKKPKKKGNLPSWVKPGADGDDDDSADKSLVAADSEKHMPDPRTASGAEEPASMESAPLGTLLESPAKPHMKGAQDAIMRYKTIGMDTDLGMLHDFTCPAYDPNEVAQIFPLAGVDTLIDTELWQRKALNAATGKSLNEAMEAQTAWQAVSILKAADPGEVNQYRFEAHKAFRDANPGPTSYPTPCEMSPAKFNRPAITDGHSDLSGGHGSPNSTAKIPDTRPNAHGFGRPPLSAGHQSPSPSHMKADFEYPQQQGVPVQIRYAEVEKEKARRALSMLHDHLNHMFPSSCPMLDQDAYRQEVPTPAALPVGTRKVTEIEIAASGGEVLGDVYKYIRKLERKVLLGEITEAEARTKLSKRTARRYAMDLQQQVSKGITSRDEVLRALGVDPSPPAAPEPPQVVQKAVTAESGGLTPEIMKTMMSEILEPLQVKITAMEERNVAQEARIEAQNTEIDTYRQRLQVNDQRWDALANQPDPSTAAFAGLALSPPATKNAPAGIVKQAENHERVQGMMIRQLERTWRTSENPAEREAAYSALLRHRNISE